MCKFFSDINYKWTITLDQDSVSPENLIYELSKHISENVGVIGPKIVYRNNEKYTRETFETIEDVDWIITSASLTNLEAWKKIEGFDEKLFIDGVDRDFCIRLKSEGYKNLVCNNVTLMHELGNLKCRKILGKTIYVTNHSPFRVYYMSRNYFYLDKKLGTHSAQKNFFKLLFKILFFEKIKLKNKGDN
jgi:rhamnosyltransferase